MKKILNIIFWIIFTPALLFSQNSEKIYSLQLNAVGGVLLHPYKITVERNQSKIKIEYQKQIRTKNIKKLQKEVLEYLKNDKNEDQKKSVIELVDKNSKYKKTKIKINESEYSSYFQLVDSVFNADWDNLLYLIDTKKYIVLDGYTIELKVIKSNYLINSSYIHTGYIKQVPLLADFKHETFNLYSKIKGRAF